METFIEKILSSAGRTVRHWWMFLVAGLLLVVGGITETELKLVYSGHNDKKGREIYNCYAWKYGIGARQCKPLCHDGSRYNA